MWLEPRQLVADYPYLRCRQQTISSALKKSPISNQDYPLTWEIQASQADYAGMAVIDPVFVQQKTAVPHTWHAAEVFLYLWEDSGSVVDSGKN